MFKIQSKLEQNYFFTINENVVLAKINLIQILTWKFILFKFEMISKSCRYQLIISFKFYTPQ